MAAILPPGELAARTRPVTAPLRHPRSATHPARMGQARHLHTRYACAVLRPLAPPLRPPALSGYGRPLAPQADRGRVRRSDGARQSGAEGGYARSEEHTSELQSLMRISYAVFCLKKNNKTLTKKQHV